MDTLIKNFECQYCKKSFNKYYIKTHVEKCKDRVQKEDISYNCDFCNKNLNSQYSLKRHQDYCKIKSGCCITCKEKLSDKCVKCSLDELEKKYEEIFKENEQLKKICSKQKDEIIKYEVEVKCREELFEKYGKNGNTTINYNSHNSSNVTLKQIVSKLEPICYDEIKNSMPLFTNEYIDDGIKGFARFLCEYSCNNRIITSDNSRNTIAYRTKFDDFIRDPECLMLIYNTLKNNSEAIIQKADERRTYYKDQIDNDPDEYESFSKRISKVVQLRKLTESTIKEKPDDNIKEIANILCNHGIKTYHKISSN